MFYIKVILKLIHKYPLRSISFFTFFTFYLSFIYNSGNLKKYFFEKYAFSESSPSFMVLYSGKIQLKNLTEKFKILPKIKEVKIINKLKIRESVKEISKNMNIPTSLLDENYAGLKFILAEDVSRKEVYRIKRVLFKYLKEENLTLTDVEWEKYKKGRDMHLFLRSWGDILINFFMSFIFLILFYFMITPLVKVGQLVELFQRKEHVSFKTFSLIILAFNFLVLLGSIVFGSPHLFRGFIFIIVNFLLLYLFLKNKNDFFEKN